MIVPDAGDARAHRNMFSNAFSSGERPLWESATFHDQILGTTLADVRRGGERGAASLKLLLDSLTLVTTQLRMLSSGNCGGVAKPAIARVLASFSRCLDTCKIMAQVTDYPTFYELLTNFMAQIKGLNPGSSMVIPAGWRGGVVLYVVHCVTFDTFSMAVCAANEGLRYHASRIDPATGEVQYNSPMILREIPVRFETHRGTGSAPPVHAHP